MVFLFELIRLYYGPRMWSRYLGLGAGKERGGATWSCEILIGPNPSQVSRCMYRTVGAMGSTEKPNRPKFYVVECRPGKKCTEILKINDPN